MRWMLCSGLIAVFLTGRGAASQEPATPKVPAEALTLTLTMDRTEYRLGEEASAEVRLRNCSSHPIRVHELLLESRSLSFEIAGGTPAPIVYTVTRPDVFSSQHAGPWRVLLGAGRDIAVIVPIPLVRPGSHRITAVYRGAGSPDSGLRSPPVPVNVSADPGPTLVATLDLALPDRRDVSSLVIGLEPDNAPVHVMNFINLARQGFYDGQRVFRIVPDFVIQSGCPRGSGSGGPGYCLPNEHVVSRRHTRGTLSMNHPPGRPDAAGSQFFLCVKDAPSLDLPGERYTAFGQVLEGIETLDAASSIETDPKTLAPLSPVLIRRVAISAR